MRVIGASLLLLFVAIGCGVESETTTSEPAGSTDSGSTVAADAPTDPVARAVEEVADGSAILLDVRTAGEWEDGHFEHATHIPRSDVTASTADSEALAGLDKGKQVYAHCAKGKRAVAAADHLRELGFKVEALETDYATIKEAGFAEAKK